MIFGVFVQNRKVAAVEIRDSQGESGVIERDIDDDVYILGEENVNLSSYVYGDVFVLGGKVNISGNVEGDVYVMGGEVVLENSQLQNIIGGEVNVLSGNVTIKSEVLGNVKILAGEAVIDGKLSQDLMIAGGKIKLSGEVDGDVRIASGEVAVDDVEIAEDLLLGGGKSSISGKIGGDLVISSQELTLRDLKIGRDLIVYREEGETFTVPQTVKVKGKFEQKITNDESKMGEVDLRPFSERFFGTGLYFRFGFSLVNAVGLIVLGFFLYKMAPVKVVSITKSLTKKNILLNGFIGFACLWIGGILAILLAISIVGWHLMAFLLMLTIIVSICALPLFSFKVGRFILYHLGEKESHPILELIAGIGLLSLVKIIPIIGMFVHMGIVFVILGTVVRNKYDALVYHG